MTPPDPSAEAKRWDALVKRCCQAQREDERFNTPETGAAALRLRNELTQALALARQQGAEAGAGEALRWAGRVAQTNSLAGIVRRALASLPLPTPPATGQGEAPVANSVLRAAARVANSPLGSTELGSPLARACFGLVLALKDAGHDNLFRPDPEGCVVGVEVQPQPENGVNVPRLVKTCQREFEKALERALEIRDSTEAPDDDGVLIYRESKRLGERLDAALRAVLPQPAGGRGD